MYVIYIDNIHIPRVCGTPVVLDLFIVGGSYQAVFQYQGGWASSFLSGFWGVPWYTLRKSHTFLAAKSLINGGSHGKLIY